MERTRPSTSTRPNPASTSVSSSETRMESGTESESEELNQLNIWENFQGKSTADQGKIKLMERKVTAKSKEFRSKGENALRAELEAAIRHFSAGDVSRILEETDLFPEEEMEEMEEKLKPTHGLRKSVNFKKGIIILTKAVLAKYRTRKVKLGNIISRMNLEYFWESREKLSWKAYQRLRAEDVGAEDLEGDTSEGEGITRDFVKGVKSRIREALKPHEGDDSSLGRKYSVNCEEKEDFVMVSILESKTVVTKRGTEKVHYFNHGIAFQPKFPFLYVQGNSETEELVGKVTSSLNPKYTRAKFMQLDDVGLERVRGACHRPTGAKNLEIIEKIMEEDAARVEELWQQQQTPREDRPIVEEIDLMDYLRSQSMISQPDPVSVRKRAISALLDEENPEKGLKKFSIIVHQPESEKPDVTWTFKADKNRSMDSIFKTLAERGDDQSSTCYLMARGKKKNVIKVKPRASASETGGNMFEEMDESE